MNKLYKITKVSSHRIYYEFSDEMKQKLSHCPIIITSELLELPKDTIVDIYKDDQNLFDSRQKNNNHDNSIYINQNSFHKNYFTSRIISLPFISDTFFSKCYLSYIKDPESIAIYAIINIDDCESIDVDRNQIYNNTIKLISDLQSQI